MILKCIMQSEGREARLKSLQTLCIHLLPPRKRQRCKNRKQISSRLGGRTADCKAEGRGCLGAYSGFWTWWWLHEDLSDASIQIHAIVHQKKVSFTRKKKIKNQFLLIKWLHTTMTSQATKRDKIFTHIEPTKDNYLEDINVFNQGTEEGNG